MLSPPVTMPSDSFADAPYTSELRVTKEFELF